jgi:glycerol uptake facilitator-like aquaporin
MFCRGLVLLNIMTFVMGTNWVVLKESNEAFDPVRALTRQLAAMTWQQSWRLSQHFAWIELAAEAALLQ